MKCICGYEQNEPFEHYRLQIPTINPRVFQVYDHKQLFICPKCGTVKFEEADHVRND